jgi:hypothetical protein
MYGMGGMAKDVLKNTFLSKSRNKQKQTVRYEGAMNPETGVASLGHIEQRAAARNIVDQTSRPTHYIPPRIQRTEKSSNVFKGASFTGCTYVNGFLNDSVLTGCIIDGNKNKFKNLDLDFSNIEVEGLATINQLKVTRVGSHLIPTTTNTYNVGSSSLKWNYFYGRFFDACYGYYLGDTNHFSMVRTSDSSDTLITNAMGDLLFDTTTTDKGTIFRLGTDTSATYFKIQNNSESSLFTVDGTGQADLTGNLDVSGGINIDTDDNSLTIGASADLSFVHNGTNSNIVSTTGNLVIDNTNTTGATIVQLGTNTDATDFQVKNDSGTTLFEVNGAGEATLSGCTVIDDIKICNNQIGHATDDTDLMTLTSGLLTVAGNVSATQFIMTSDKNLKKQIKNLDKDYDEETLDQKFDRLEPVKFKWKKQAANSSIHSQSIRNNIKEKYQYGLIAQNVLEEFPECAFQKPDGYLGIDYMGLSSILILKIQNQNDKIKEKETRILNLENIVKKQEIILSNIIQRMEKLEYNIDSNSTDSNSTDTYCMGRSWDKSKDRDFDDFGGRGNGYGGGGCGSGVLK